MQNFLPCGSLRFAFCFTQFLLSHNLQHKSAHLLNLNEAFARYFFFLNFCYNFLCIFLTSNLHFLHFTFRIIFASFNIYLTFKAIYVSYSRSRWALTINWRKKKPIEEKKKYRVKLKQKVLKSEKRQKLSKMFSCLWEKHLSLRTPWGSTSFAAVWVL